MRLDNMPPRLMFRITSYNVCYTKLLRLVLITGILVPMGIISPEKLSYERVHAFATSWWGALILLATIALPICHAMHRIYHGLHDVGVHTTLV